MKNKTGLEITLFTALLASLLLAPTAAHAEGPSVSVGLRTMTLIDTDRSLDPLAGDDLLIHSGLFFDIEPLRALLPGPQRLRLGLEWMINSNDVKLFESLHAGLTAHHLLATIDYGYEALPWLTIYGRTGLGVGFYDLEISTDNSTLDSDDHGVFSGHAGGGVEVIVPYSFWNDTPGDNTFGARLEGGHSFRANPDFTVTRAHTTPEDQKEMPLKGASLGDVDLNGWYFGFDLFARF